ncbi:hypothetical protein CBL_07952 [Carabus blaptoides fortunei]
MNGSISLASQSRYWTCHFQMSATRSPNGMMAPNESQYSLYGIPGCVYYSYLCIQTANRDKNVLRQVLCNNDITSKVQFKISVLNTGHCLVICTMMYVLVRSCTLKLSHSTVKCLISNALNAFQSVTICEHKTSSNARRTGILNVCGITRKRVSIRARTKKRKAGAGGSPNRHPVPYTSKTSTCNLILKYIYS